MPRPLRIEYNGAWYHVFNRGLDKTTIFNKPYHFVWFMKLISEATYKFSAECHSYCLMTNHYHLLIHTPKGNLAEIMRYINGLYTQKYNYDMQRDGPIFRGRYQAKPIEKDNYLIWISRYIHLNPINAGIVNHPREYPWSSFKYFIEAKPKPDWLFTEEVLSCMLSSTPTKSYNEFVCNELQGFDPYSLNQLDHFMKFN